MSSEDENYIAQQLTQRLEVNVDDFRLGYIKGYVEGFRSGSLSSSKKTNISFITKIILEGNNVTAPEYCEVVKTEGDIE